MKKFIIFLCLIISLINLNKNSYSYDYCKVDNIEDLNYFSLVEKLDLCKYDNYHKNRNKYKFCKVKLNKCWINSPGSKNYLYYLKYKDKVSYITYLNFPEERKNKNLDKVIYSLISCESNWNPFILSIDNGYGFFQLTSVNKKNKNDIEENIKVGLNHLRYFYEITKNKDYVNKIVESNDCKYKNYIYLYFTLRYYNGGSK